MLRSESHREVNICPLPRRWSIRTLRFPNKLWRIVNDCKTGAITWSDDGKSIVIDYTKFQLDCLTSRAGIFRTSNIRSFIRQLNMYGFRKVSPNNRMMVKNQDTADIHLFRNDSFLRDRPDLLQNVTRKSVPLRIRGVRRRKEPKPRLPHGLRSQGTSPTHRCVASKRQVSHLRARSHNSRSANGACDMPDDPWLLNRASSVACMGDEPGDECHQGCYPSSVEEPGLDIQLILDPSTSPRRVFIAFEEDNYSLEDSFGFASLSIEPLGEVYDIFTGDVSAADFRSDESFTANMAKVSCADVSGTDEDLLGTAMQISACFSGNDSLPEVHSLGGSWDETPSDWNQLSVLAADVVGYAGSSTMSDVASIGYGADAADLCCVSELSNFAEAGSTAEKGMLF